MENFLFRGSICKVFKMICFFHSHIFALFSSIIATPGRFTHVLVEMEMKLSSVEYVVFDEADRWVL